MMNCCCCCTGKQSKERTMSGSALPEHPQQECCKKRSIDKSEDQLQKIHEIIEKPGHIGCPNTYQNTKDRSHLTHPQVVLIRFLWVDITLVYIVGPHRVKGSHIA